MSEDYVYPFTAWSAGPGRVALSDNREEDITYISITETMQLIKSLSSAVQKSLVEGELRTHVTLVSQVPYDMRYCIEQQAGWSCREEDIGSELQRRIEILEKGESNG